MRKAQVVSDELHIADKILKLRGEKFIMSSRQVCCNGWQSD